MGWKKFAIKALKVITIMIPTAIVLSLLFDMSTLNFIGGSVWSLNGLILLIVSGFIIWAVATVTVLFIHNIRNRLTRTKEPGEGKEKKTSKVESNVIDAVEWTIK